MTPASQPSRREFIQTSSALAVGGALALNFGAGSVHAAGDETIKVGLIGCGGRGTGAASQALKTAGPVKLVAVGDAFQDRLTGSLNNLEKEGLKDRMDVPKERQFVGFDAYKQVIDSGVDLVILATPPGFRPIHFTAAVDAGKHVFMEKPVAVDGTGVRQVLEAAKKSKERGLAVGVGLQRHHDAGYEATVARLRDGAIGDIVASRAYWNSGGVWVNPRKEGQTEMEHQMRNWYYYNWLCGDHIVEQHIHNLDVINWVKNATPVSAQGMGGREVRKGDQYGEIYDHFAVEFIYADGSRCFSYCRHQPNTWNQVSEFCQGTKGTADPSGRIMATGQDEWRFREKKGNPYQVEHDVLFASIRANKPINEAEYGATSTMTSILGRLACYSGQVVKWEEALNSPKSLAPKTYAWDADIAKAEIAVPGQFKV